MKAIVIGGAGFIGSHLCEGLLRQGDEVICVDDLSLGAKKNIAHLLDHPHFSFQIADASNIENMESVFEKEKPQMVYHLAANSDIQASAKDPLIEYKNTYSTTFSVLSCMRKFGVEKLFFASTSAVYGDKRDVLLDENTPNLSPISYYGAAKLGSEALISAFSYMNDMSALVFRFPNVIGPRLTHGVIFDFMKRLRDDPTHLMILGDGRQTKPYIYVTDLIDAILQLSKDLEKGVSLYNIGVDGATSVTTIADIICEEMGLSNVSYEFTGGEGGWKGDVPRFLYSIDRVHAAGWRANYSSDDAVRMTVRAELNK